MHEDKVFSVTKERGEHRNPFNVNDERGQLGQLHVELGSPLWPLQTNIFP